MSACTQEPFDYRVDLLSNVLSLIKFALRRSLPMCNLEKDTAVCEKIQKSTKSVSSTAQVVVRQNTRKYKNFTRTQ